MAKSTAQAQAVQIPVKTEAGITPLRFKSQWPDDGNDGPMASNGCLKGEKHFEMKPIYRIIEKKQDAPMQVELLVFVYRSVQEKDNNEKKNHLAPRTRKNGLMLKSH